MKREKPRGNRKGWDGEHGNLSSIWTWVKGKWPKAPPTCSEGGEIETEKVWLSAYYD